MAIVKKIKDNSGSGKVFEDVTTSEVTYDTTPQLGSFNPVTSDGVAKAIAGASGEVPAVNPGDAGKVLTAGFDGDTPTVSWEEAQGAEYTAGTGISISDSNAISCTVQAPTAGNGIDIQNGEISVKHDSTLTDVGGRQTVELTPSIEFNSHDYSSRSEAWFWAACAITVPAEDANHVNFTISVDSYLTWPWGDIDPAGKQVVGIVAKPTDPTAYYVAALKDSNYENVYVNEYRAMNSGTYEVPNSGRAEIYKQNLSGIGAAIVDGKVTVALGLYDQTQHTLITASNAQGPLYNGVPLYVYVVAETYVAGPEGDTPVEPGPDAVWSWNTGSHDPITKTIGEGTASLSVANPVPSVDGQTGKFLKAGSSGPEWDTVNEVPAVNLGDDGKVLGVVDYGLQWVNAGTTYSSASSASVTLSVNDLVVTSTADVTNITVRADAKSAVVQWTVASTTTLPTVVDGNNNPLKASVNNPASLTVGRTVQVSILNGTWVCAEFA